jgi:NAD(P)-dependent dehydrogenase (short-subunit alcohol dehydrogenase family)
MAPAILITGAASGIGRATALAAARAGYDLIAWDIQEGLLADLETQVDVAITTASFDVTDSEARRQALDAARSTHPMISGFVHAAGVSGAEPISAFTPDSWARTIDINLTTAAAMTHELADDLAASGHGAIVYISSVEGWFGHEWLPAYCSSKAGLLGLARAAGMELAKRNVRVNCVCPGAIETPMLQPLLDFEEFTERTISRTPLGRIGQPDDIADVILFLLSQQARFVTGTSLVVDGGLTSIGGI